MSAAPAAPAGSALRRRRWLWWGLLLAVSALHLLAGRWIDQRISEGRGDQLEALKTIQVEFVRELAPSLPPQHAAAPAARRPRAAVAPAHAASAPEPAPAAEVAPAMVLASAEPASAPPPTMAEPPAAPASLDLPGEFAPSATAEAFDWPPSTQLLYSMTGQYRGPITGSAQVDWLREGDHYQVRLEVRVPPLFTRRMISDGQLGPEGLAPQRYDQETQVALQAVRRETVRFEAGQVLLSNGGSSERPAGVQDVASQFVQMTWLFLTDPSRLQVGRTVDFPLALPRRVGRWTYEVAERVMLPLPFGEVEAFHLRPRRDVLRPSELSVETWVAPSLQYLPVRILIRQDAESYLELQLQSRPRQAAAGGSGARP